MNDADAIIATLGLTAHPEGGFYREMFRDGVGTARAHSTAIYYLLRAGEESRWHRVDAAEIWHFYAGEALALFICDETGAEHRHVLGIDLSKGERPQIVVPAGEWQSAKPLGRYTLAGCTVAPGFEFSGFEMAPPDWKPG